MTKISGPKPRPVVQPTPTTTHTPPTTTPEISGPAAPRPHSFEASRAAERQRTTGHTRDLPASTSSAPAGTLRAGDLNPRRELRPPAREGLRGGLGDQVSDARVQAGQEAAQDLANNPVYSDPSRAMSNMTQIDDDRGANRGGHDSYRCGSAALTAGIVASGNPADMDRAVGRLEERVQQLRSEIPSDVGSSARNIDTIGPREELDRAEQALRTLRSRGGAQHWTQRDLSTFQQALHSTAVVDDYLAPRTGLGRTQTSLQPLDPEAGISLGAARQYRDMLWAHAPTIDGQQADINYMQTAAGGGHFVLAADGEVDGAGTEAGQRVLYDPWPDETGSPYSAANTGPGDTHESADRLLVPISTRREAARARQRFEGTRQLGPRQRWARDPDVDRGANPTPDEIRRSLDEAEIMRRLTRD